jgi:hypothetical protein
MSWKTTSVNMTDNNHPITPPPELIEDWIEIAKPVPQRPPNPGELATLAARWGADQELEACCEWIANGHSKQGVVLSDRIRAARRPKPPSLKAGAIEVLDELDGLFELPAGHYNTILRALEQLDDSL